jgi:myo-inositol 2-dehydrogenase / D-chiro-inositol 1-dehydrogenase
LTRPTLGFGVLGAGRIGALHARNLAGSVDGAQLVAVMDADPDAAQRAAYGSAAVCNDVEALLTHPGVDAVLIASPTPLHTEQIEASARAGKAIFCEKPVALDLETTQRALAVVRETGVPFQIGFNRRFDAGFREVARAVHAGELGKPEMFRSQSSDPTPPPESYVATSGGIFLDSVIHDLDIARFMMGEIVRVTALGRVLVAPYLGAYGDIDTSILTLEFAGGAIGVIQNSRRTVHGYDLRVEVHGERGKLVTEAERATQVWKYGEAGIQGDYIYYFLERFRDAYRAEVQAFVDAVREGRTPTPGAEDALEALRLALAATKSLREKRPVEVSEIAT